MLYDYLNSLAMAVTVIVITALISFVSYFLYKLVKFLQNYSYVRSIPGPPIYSFLRGNSIDSQESTSSFTQVLAFRKKWVSKSPKVCRFAVGPFNQLMCCHPDTTKTVINDNYPKHPAYDLLRGWVGDGLLTSKGDKWFKHRKLLTPAFHYEILDGFFDVYTACVDLMLDLWNTELSEKGHVILQDWIPYLTLDILLQCICSVKTDCQIKREELQYVRDIAGLTSMLQTRFRNPAKYYFDFIFKRTQLGIEFYETCKRAKQFTYNIILERKRQISDGNTQRNSKNRDFLDILLHASDPITGTSLTDLEIRDEVDTFVFEGHDTTASALTWTLYLLAKHDKYQEMCRQEVIQVSEGKPALTRQIISSLKFLPMCVKESLRIFPPVMGISRCPSKPCKLGEYNIPTGLFVTIGIYQMQNHPDLWEKPDEFNPYRFSAENIDKIPLFSYIPFSAGPRNCIGQNMALHELNFVVARILTRFKLELPSDFPKEIEYDYNILLKPKFPMKLVITAI